MEAFKVLVLLAPLALFGGVAWILAQAIKVAASRHPPVSTEPSNSTGVGGWLLLLITIFMFLGPLMDGGAIGREFKEAEVTNPGLPVLAEWISLKSLTWWSFLASSLLSIYAGLGLINIRSRRAVKRAQIILWITGPIVSAWYVIVIPFIALGATNSGPEVIGSLAASIISTAVWSAYLSRSKRVKATYGAKRDPLSTS